MKRTTVPKSWIKAIRSAERQEREAAKARAALKITNKRPGRPDTGRTVHLGVLVETSVYLQVKALAAIEDRTASALIYDAVERYIARASRAAGLWDFLDDAPPPKRRPRR